MTLHIKTTSLTNILKKYFMYLLKWFHYDYMVLNPGKRYYMTFGLNTTRNEFVTKNGTIFLSAEKNVALEITIYSCLTFYSYLK